MNTIKELVDAVRQNNRFNDGKWSDWNDAYDIEEVYGKLKYKGNLRQQCLKILNEAIRTEGKSVEDKYLDEKGCYCSDPGHFYSDRNMIGKSKRNEDLD